MAQITKVEIFLDGVLHQTLTVAPFDRVDTASLNLGSYTLTGNVFIDGALHHTIPARTFTVAAPFSIDADYQAVLDYATANSIALPSEAQQLIDNQRMLDLKAAGIYQKSDVLLNTEPGATAQFRQIDWKRKLFLPKTGTGNINIGSGGLRPDSTAYINLQYNPSTQGVNYTLNNAGVLYYITENVVSGTSFTFGVQIGSDQFGVMGNRPSGDNVYSINSAASLLGTPLQKIGMNGLHRNAASGAASSKFIGGDGVTTNFTTASAGIPNGDVYLFGRNTDGTFSNGSIPRIRFLSIGANMEAEQAALKTILES